MLISAHSNPVRSFPRQLSAKPPQQAPTEQAPGPVSDSIELSAAPSPQAKHDSAPAAMAATGGAIGGAMGQAFKLLMMGPPGSGKSTQGKVVAAERGIPHISTGSLLRAEVEAGTELGKEIDGYMSRGEMVPDEIVATVLKKRLEQDDTKDGYVLDGFPRTMPQLPTYDEMFPEGMSVIAIDVADDEIRRRLLARGRKDDTPEVIERRIQVYKEETAPLVAEFERRGVLTRVDGNGSVDETRERVREAIQD